MVEVVGAMCHLQGAVCARLSVWLGEVLGGPWTSLLSLAMG